MVVSNSTSCDTVTITNTNTASSESSLSLGYGDSGIVTITPNANYHLSNVSCPENYTCTLENGSTIDTSISATSAQVIKITNKSTTDAAVSFSALQFMQTFSCAQFANVHDSATVTDIRDGKQYTIAKLKDNNCWMTEDLKFTLTEGDILKPATTNVSVETTVTNNDATGNPATTQAASSTATTWCTTHSADCDNQYKSISYGVQNGYLYNWYAATAGTGTYSTTGTVSSSICPKGWTLPVNGTTSGTYEYLLKQYGWTGSNTNQASFITNTMFATPLNFNDTGHRTSDTTGTIYGVYHTRTAYDNGHMYDLNFLTSSGYLYPRNYGDYKNRGYAIRCLVF